MVQRSSRKPSLSTPDGKQRYIDTMEEVTATQLLELTNPPKPFIRLEDTLLKLEEAEEVTAKILKVIEHCYDDWMWPSPEIHLNNGDAEQYRAEDRTRDEDEDEEAYIKRLNRLDARPQVIAVRGAAWLTCTLITAFALKFLHNCSAQGMPLCGTSHRSHYYFDPKRMYEYTWICLNQGYGTRTWKQNPERPSTSESDLGAWYSKKACETVEAFITKWHSGMSLESILPVMTFGDFRFASKDLETILFVKRKIACAADEVAVADKAKAPRSRKRQPSVEEEQKSESSYVRKGKVARPSEDQGSAH